MSFSDLMSSSRGPGVIGMLLALVVLVGFAVLFLFTFDERFQGKKLTIEAEIEQLVTDNEHLIVQAEDLNQQLSKQPKRAELIRELNNVKRENQFRESEIADLGKRIITAKEVIDAKNKEFDAYKDQYRTFVRNKAKGTTYDSLKTRNGEVYQKVEVREVTAVGMQIIHDDGHKRIPYEDLPPDVQDYFQFDASQKQSALFKEAKHRQQHDAAVAAADVAVIEAAKNQRQKEENTLRSRSAEAAEAAQIRIFKLEEEIRALNLEIRIQSNKSLSRAPQLRQQLEAKEQEKSALSQKLAEWRSQGN